MFQGHSALHPIARFEIQLYENYACTYVDKRGLNAALQYTFVTLLK